MDKVIILTYVSFHLFDFKHRYGVEKIGFLEGTLEGV